MPWETFKRGTRYTPDEPAISIAPPGRIGLNVAVVKNIIMHNGFKFAVLMYDKEKRWIGFKFSKVKEPDAYPLMVNVRGSSATVAGTSFLKTYGIPHEATTKYRATYDAQAKMLIVNLSEETELKGRGKV